MKLATQLRKAEREEAAARKRRLALQDRLYAEETVPKLRQLVGKCFRIRTCYSCPESDADYWYVYVRFYGMDSDGWLQAMEIDRDSVGKIGVRQNTYQQLLASMEPISNAEYVEAVWPVISDVLAMSSAMESFPRPS